MSHKVNLEYEEKALESFQSYAAEKDWNSINEMFLELQDQGFGHVEIKLVETLTEDQLWEFRAWNEEN